MNKINMADSEQPSTMDKIKEKVIEYFDKAKDYVEKNSRNATITIVVSVIINLVLITMLSSKRKK
jgi:hypothetical protein